MVKLPLLISGVLAVTSVIAQKQQSPNVIFLVGDGMGLSQVSSAYFYSETEPNFTRFTDFGFIKTPSADHKVTDSAAGATAFACGKKTYNGAIGKDTAKVDIENLLELLAAKCGDCKTGLIATSSITHATPGSFFAHADYRHEQELIAAQLAPSNVDYFAGGGLKYFTEREDGLNYLDTLKQWGFEVTTGAFTSPKVTKGKKFGYLGAADGMPKIKEGRGDFLPNATKHGIEQLNGNQPFFMMIEGSQIDWAGHANDDVYMKGEVLDFDKTIGLALDFAAKDGNTLVIVTADHETGGYTLAKAVDIDSADHTEAQVDGIQPTFSTGGHSATLIPVFAYGPGAENFKGIYENTALFHKMKDALRLK